MSSHGRTGPSSWPLGSVAYQVLHCAPAPVLLVRAQVNEVPPAHLRGPQVYQCHHLGSVPFPPVKGHEEESQW